MNDVLDIFSMADQRYKAFSDDFSDVRSYLIRKDGELVATITAKFRRAQAAHAYICWPDGDTVQGKSSVDGFGQMDTAVVNAARTFIAEKSPARSIERLLVETIAASYCGWAGQNDWQDRLLKKDFTILRTI